MEEYIENINRLLKENNITDNINVNSNSLGCMEVKDIIDRNLYNLLNSHIDDKHKIYQLIAKANGENLIDGTLVLEKELPTGDMIEVMFYNIEGESIYLYCGIPRYNVKDKDSNITYFHYLERKLKSYVYETYKIEEKNQQEEYIYDHFYRSYVIDALSKVLEICMNNQSIKNLRIDCNKRFSNRIGPILMELGFVSVPLDYPERINFLREKYPEYQLPEQIDLLFNKYPDREVAYNVHLKDLDDRLELIKNMYVDEKYESDTFLENESSIVEDFNNSLPDEEII